MKKKWYFLLLAAVLPMLAVSLGACSDDDDLPNVDISLSVTANSISDGVIYVAQGDTLYVDALTVSNNVAGKRAELTNVAYYWDNLMYSPTIVQPFAMAFPIGEGMAVGRHTLGVNCTVLAIDKSPATAALTYPVMVVADASEIPAGAATGTLTGTLNLTGK